MKVKQKMAEISYIGLFLMIFIVAVVGVSLITPVAQQTGVASADSNMDNASSTLISMNTLFFVLLVLSGVAGLTMLSLRLIGII